MQHVQSAAHTCLMRYCYDLLPPPAAGRLCAVCLQKRTFRKFTYRGVDLDQLLDMNSDELIELFHARARRRWAEETAAAAAAAGAAAAAAATTGWGFDRDVGSAFLTAIDRQGQRQAGGVVKRLWQQPGEGWLEGHGDGGCLEAQGQRQRPVA